MVGKLHARYGAEVVCILYITERQRAGEVGHGHGIKALHDEGGVEGKMLRPARLDSVRGGGGYLCKIYLIKNAKGARERGIEGYIYLSNG